MLGALLGQHTCFHNTRATAELCCLLQCMEGARCAATYLRVSHPWSLAVTLVVSSLPQQLRQLEVYYTEGQFDPQFYPAF